MLGVGAHERRMFTPPQPPQKTTLFQRHAHFRGAVRTVFAGPLRPTGAESPRAHNLRTIQPTNNQKRIHNQKRSLLDTQRWNTYTYITSYICQSDTPPKQKAHHKLPLTSALDTRFLPRLSGAQRSCRRQNRKHRHNAWALLASAGQRPLVVSMKPLHTDGHTAYISARWWCR